MNAEPIPSAPELLLYDPVEPRVLVRLRLLVAEALREKMLNEEQAREAMDFLDSPDHA